MAALPLRIRIPGGPYKTVRIGREASSLEVERAVAIAFDLRVGTFGLMSDEGISSTFDAGLTGDWDVKAHRGKSFEGEVTGAKSETLHILACCVRSRQKWAPTYLQI